MNTLNILKVLLKGTPNHITVAKAMNIMGAICIVTAIWNYLYDSISPDDSNVFKLPPNYSLTVFLAFLLIGLMFFASARDIRHQKPRGKRIGQLSIALFATALIYFVYYVIQQSNIPFNMGNAGNMLRVFLILFSVQIAIPASFGIIYLERLPNIDTTHCASQRWAKGLNKKPQYQSLDSALTMKYKNALFPFGIFITFVLFIAVFFIGFFVLSKLIDNQEFHRYFLVFFLLVFFSPSAYNYIPSPFQKGKIIVSSHTGGGSIYLISGSWPFFRLLIYQDGIEIRFMFHRFFIPLDKLMDLPEKIGFFSRGILIKSDLPDVPSAIRFSGLGLKDILSTLHETRNRYQAAKVN